MKRSALAILSISLLCSAAIPALAQDAGCARLQKLTDANRQRFQQAWIKAADNIIKQGNAKTCEQYALDAEKGARQLDAQAASQAQDKTAQAQQNTTGSNIVVTQPKPEVTVQQQAPQVAVTQQQPEVTVNQQQPQIIVRQAQPTMRVQMPQPVITIDQPQPEIIVRMPQPQVAVNQPAPDVKVTQQQPEVQVKQAKPQVQVQMQQPEVNVQPNQQAQVNVQREQPVVQMQKEGQPQVNVQQAQPQVSYEAAKPKIEFDQGGQPKVQFTESGKPNVKIEQMANQSAVQDQQQASNSPGNSEITGNTELPGLSEKDRQRLGTLDANEKAGKLSTVEVSNLLKRNVVNRQGEKIGTVDAVVRRGGQDFLVISHGGFLGIGEKTVALPAERMSMAGDGNILLRGLTEQEFENLPHSGMTDAQTLAADQTINLPITTQ